MELFNVKFENLTEEKKQVVEKTLEECLTIFVSALLRIEREIDSLMIYLNEEEKI